MIILGLRVLQRESPKIGNPAPLTGPPQTKTDGVSSTPSAVASVPTSSTAPQAQNRQAGNRTNPIYPIVALTPYQNNWRIKARVVQKSDIRHYSNQRGEGRFFSVTFMDDSGEIKGTAWNALVDELYEKLQENHVYFVSKARVNLAKKKFSTVSNDYELSLDRGIEIEEVRSSLHFLQLATESNAVPRCRCSRHPIQLHNSLEPTGSPERCDMRYISRLFQFIGNSSIDDRCYRRPERCRRFGRNHHKEQ